MWRDLWEIGLSNVGMSEIDNVIYGFNGINHFCVVWSVNMRNQCRRNVFMLLPRVVFFLHLETTDQNFNILQRSSFPRIDKCLVTKLIGVPK